MKPSAILINVSRGPVIDDDALISALREHRIAGAALDVFATQPLPPDHPYFTFDNVIITPHMAGITEESMMRMGVGAAEEALRVLAGELPVNLRNPEVVPQYRARLPADRAAAGVNYVVGSHRASQLRHPGQGSEATAEPGPSVKVAEGVLVAPMRADQSYCAVPGSSG